MYKKIALLLMLVAGFDATATVMTNCPAVKLTNVQTNSGVNIPLPVSLPVNSAFCYESVSGNDSVNVSSTNLGYKNDGYLNTSQNGLWGEYGAFTRQDELQDLKTPGVFVDPGWVYFGKNTSGVFTPGTSSKGNDSYTYTPDLFTLSNCLNKNGVLDLLCSGADLVKGEWQLKPPVNNPAALLKLLGADRFFDSIAIIFKSGNEHAIYNFNVSQLGLQSGIGTTSQNFVFKGQWDMSNVLLTGRNNVAAGLSHVSIWGRDPQAEPATVSTSGAWLLLSAGLGLLVSRRLKK